MPALSLTVDWLDGIYHASRESRSAKWPPSPFQLYQAMIAGYAVHRRGDPALEAAMRHLEGLDPPTIHAPEAEEWKPVAFPSLANNDDKSFDRWAKGDRLGALTKTSRAGELRVMYPRRFDGAVTYRWSANPETERHFGALKEIVESVTAVGYGIDMVVARLELADRPARPPGVAYTPSPTGRRLLDVPYSGAFDELENRYAQFRGRLQPEGVIKVSEPYRREVSYASELDMPSISSEGFMLRDMDDRPLSFEGTRAMAVAGMARHAMNVAARRAGLPQQTISELMGHGSKGREELRILVHPLPNAGRKHADGRIRRVMLTAPKNLVEDVWLGVRRRLIGAELVPEGQTAPIGRLEPIRRDSVLGRYYEKAEEWTTATPVVLWGRDHRGGRPRPERSVRRLLRRAGIPEALLESATLEPAPRLAGSARAFEYDRPRHLADYPCQHMTIRWRKPVEGPIRLGAGIGYGLGLFLPRESRTGCDDAREGRQVVEPRGTLDPAGTDERRRGHEAWARGDYEAAERHFLAGGDEDQARGVRRRADEQRRDSAT